MNKNKKKTYKYLNFVIIFYHLSDIFFFKYSQILFFQLFIINHKIEF